MPEERSEILIVDDVPEQRKLLGRFVESLGHTFTEAGSAEDALEQIRQHAPAMVLLDVRLPGMSGLEALPLIRRDWAALPVLLITAHADLRQAVAAMKTGADDYLAKPVDLRELQTVIEDVLGTRRKRQDEATGPSELVPGELPRHFVCESPAMRQVVETVAIVAPSDVTVLILGESGCGKEEIARLLHEWSPRSQGPLVSANCAGLPESLIESELFGHAKGAFTGASQERKGFFRSAEGGTLFLDEIGELPLALQPKLLRVLEAKQVTPVGSDRAIEVDIRLLVATNRQLSEAVADGSFRDDLYYRINVVEVVLPPLRERQADIAPLARHFAREFSETHVRFSPQALQCLLTHAWPGNVRELRNAIQRACLLCRGDVILPEHLPPKIASLAAIPTDSEARESRGRLSEVERATILATLEECAGNRTHAAKKLGISRRALIYKLRAIENEG